jgi:hypothetical protein
MRSVMIAMLLVAVCALVVAGCDSCPMCGGGKAAMKMQTKCCCGKPIDKASYADVDGMRIYTCGEPACVDKIKADPKAAMEMIKKNGEMCMPIPKTP